MAKVIRRRSLSNKPPEIRAYDTGLMLGMVGGLILGLLIGLGLG